MSFMLWSLRRQSTVALLAEGVDRNLFVGDVMEILGIVALLAEGVDRNCVSACWRVL